jgi:hypothetical protein
MMNPGTKFAIAAGIIIAVIIISLTTHYDVRTIHSENTSSDVLIFCQHKSHSSRNRNW